jgi:transcriptional antiterminator NusG
MPRNWYVVHTYSGYEHKVKTSLEERVRAGRARLPAEIANLDAKPNKTDKDVRRLQEARRELAALEGIGEVLVPAEKVVELVKGQKKTSSRKFFPGYILVNMELNDDTWHIVKSTPKVTGFVGGATNPPPISDEEVREITQQMEEGAARPKPKVLFEAGESVKVIDGPFQDFNGVVEEVKADKGKLRVLISIFGRATPVELDFVQVEKA